MRPIINDEYKGIDAIAITRFQLEYSYSIMPGGKDINVRSGLNKELEDLRRDLGDGSKSRFEVLIRYYNINLERVEAKVSGAVINLNHHKRVDLVKLLDN